jgi:hypothetical protein
LALQPNNDTTVIRQWAKASVNRPAPARPAPRCGNSSWKEYKDVALLQQFLGDCDIKSAMRYVNIDGKEASRLMRKRKAG